MYRTYLCDAQGCVHFRRASRDPKTAGGPILLNPRAGPCQRGIEPLGTALAGPASAQQALSWIEHQTTNLGVRSSNLFGRASSFGTKLSTPKAAVFALEAATSVRSNTLFEPMMRSSFVSIFASFPK